MVIKFKKDEIKTDKTDFHHINKEMMNHLIDDIRKIPILKILIPLVLGILCYQHFFSEDSFPGTASSYIFDSIMTEEVLIYGVLKRAPEQRSKSYRLDMDISGLCVSDTVYGIEENIVVYLVNTTDSLSFMPGDKLVVRGKLSQITNKGNPGEFDYASYMARQGYRYVLFTYRENLHHMGVDASLSHLPMIIRHRISCRWPLKDQNAAILRALCLGDKTRLNTDTKSDFTNAGAIHVLAVSGLHIGIIWWILDLIFRFPNKRVWRIVKTSLIVLVLWNYAAVTGFSESVNRSVLMFSLVAISNSFKRKANIYNTLFLSAFILLIICPERINDPGFQLSYLAVFGIVTFQPKLKTIMHSRYKILQWIFDLLSVSIAAQLATLPLVLYHFHQFPVYFLISNLVSIPLVTVLLALFVIFLPIFLLQLPFCCADRILLWISKLLYGSMDFIAALPASHIQEIPMQGSSVFCLFLIIFAFAAVIYYKRLVFLFMLMFFSIIMFIVSGLRWHNEKGQQQFICYNFTSLSAFSFQKGMSRVLFVFPESDSLGYFEQKYFQNSFLVPYRMKSVEYINLNTEEKEVFRITEGIWAFEYFEWSVLLLGECRLDELVRVLESRKWNEIVLRTGFPNGTIETLEKHGIKNYRFDGTVKEWERKNKKH